MNKQAIKPTTIGSSTDTPTTTQSFNMMKNLLRTTISSILYLRNLLPEEAFYDKNLAGLSIKSLDASKNEEASIICDWLEQGVFDALEKKYLKTISFGFYLDPKSPDKMLENYTFNISYPSENEIQLQSCNSKSSSKIHSRTKIKEAAVSLIRTLVTLAQTLDPVPSDRLITMRLYYYPHTPEDYNPAFFVDTQLPLSDLSYLGGQPLSLEIGDLATPYHTLRLKMKSSMDKFTIDDTKGNGSKTKNRNTSSSNNSSSNSSSSSNCGKEAQVTPVSESEIVLKDPTDDEKAEMEIEASNNEEKGKINNTNSDNNNVNDDDVNEDDDDDDTTDEEKGKGKEKGNENEGENQAQVQEDEETPPTVPIKSSDDRHESNDDHDGSSSSSNSDVRSDGIEFEADGLKSALELSYHKAVLLCDQFDKLGPAEISTNLQIVPVVAKEIMIRLEDNGLFNIKYYQRGDKMAKAPYRLGRDVSRSSKARNLIKKSKAWLEIHEEAEAQKQQLTSPSPGLSLISLAPVSASQKSQQSPSLSPSTSPKLPTVKKARVSKLKKSHPVKATKGAKAKTSIEPERSEQPKNLKKTEDEAKTMPVAGETFGPFKVAEPSQSSPAKTSNKRKGSIVSKPVYQRSIKKRKLS